MKNKNTKHLGTPRNKLINIKKKQKEHKRRSEVENALAPALCFA